LILACDTAWPIVTLREIQLTQCYRAWHAELATAVAPARADPPRGRHGRGASGRRGRAAAGPGRADELRVRGQGDRPAEIRGFDRRVRQQGQELHRTPGPHPSR